jgi:hypothetical protein
MSKSSPEHGLTPAALVDEFLRLIMLPDPVAASRYTAPGLQIRFTGGRAMSDPRECTAFNAARYQWVKKRIERTETVSVSTKAGAEKDKDAGTAGGAQMMAGGPAGALEETVVYSLGTLYGQWPDGSPFEGNRYVDRYVVRDGLITHMDVWNDSAEWMLVRAGLATR